MYHKPKEGPMATPHKTMRKRLEEIGYEFDREGGSHTVFKHASGATMALNRGPTKDPKVIVTEARRKVAQAASTKDIGEWQPAKQLAKSQGWDSSEISKVSNKDIVRWGHCFFKREATDEDRKALALGARTKYLYRAVDARPELEGLREVPSYDAAMARLAEPPKVPKVPKVPKPKLDKAKATADAEAYALELLEENENLKRRVADAYKALPKELSDRPLADAVKQLVDESKALRQTIDQTKLELPVANRAQHLLFGVRAVIAEAKMPPRVAELEAELSKCESVMRDQEKELNAAFRLIPPGCRSGGEDLPLAVKALVARLEFADNQSRLGQLVTVSDPVRNAAVDVVLANVSGSAELYALAEALLRGGSK